ncbi:FAD-binding domain-containing protein [Gloeopeniophorella convolvens]|nr:FAD-binding domain-containing protein [Gloeopeniophorella convolvens]
MIKKIPIAAWFLLCNAPFAFCRSDGKQILLQSSSVQSACTQLERVVSRASQVSYPPMVQYVADNDHWFTSSMDFSVCTVEPGTSKDVGAIIRTLGKLRVPFAVKSGGHSSNPGFSSTRGVMISMAKFNKISFNSKSPGEVEVGVGLTWDDIYERLDPEGVNVVGGRVPGVGITGFTLGGGFSWKTRQYGLSLDNVLAFELVLPDGTVKSVTHEDEDLFYGLRGGFNNFGIVTKITFKTHPQGPVWGGLTIVGPPGLEDARAAITEFEETVVDKKAQLMPTYAYINDQAILTLFFFYDGPAPPSGIFDKVLKIPSYSQNVTSGTFNEVYKSFPNGNPFAGPRAFYGCVPVTRYGPALLDAVVNQTLHWGRTLGPQDEGVFLLYAVQPFDKEIYSHGAPSAFPPDRSRSYYPTNLYFAWTNPALDDVVLDAMHQSTDALRSAAREDGQDLTDATMYGNYALPDDPLEGIYGKNVQRLREIRRKYDPENVMGLTGGYKF